MKKWEQEDARAIERLRPLLQRLTRNNNKHRNNIKKVGNA